MPLTSKMFAALSSAEANADKGGLLYTTGGWITAREAFTYHNFGTVEALVRIGALTEHGKGKHRQRHITDTGRQILTTKGKRHG